jgi:hypothetical protein
LNAFDQQAQQEPLESTRRFFIDRKGIGFLKAIFESYEDVAIFSVLDGKSGLIELIYPRYFEKDVLAIVHDMINYGIVIKEVPDAE